ncbi:unnamed protein product, partial [Polarella glacialis]
MGDTDILGFVDVLRNDITTYLIEGATAEAREGAPLRPNSRAGRPAALFDARLADWLSSGNRLLCYNRPADAEADLWREARRSGGLDGSEAASSSTAVPSAPRCESPRSPPAGDGDHRRERVGCPGGAVPGGSSDSAPPRKKSDPSSAARVPSPEAQDEAQAAPAPAPATAGSPPPRPTRSVFGAPPLSSSIRWPPRPSEEDVLRALGRLPAAE